MKLKISGLAKIFNQKFLPLIDFYDNHVIVMYGSAGSGKSVASADIIVLSLLNNRNQLIIRKVARTLRRSVFAEVQKSIQRLKVSKYFKINKTEMTISCVNGYEAYFVGCDDPEKLKSIVPKKGMFNDIHCEEATELSFDEFMIIDSRQRGEDPRPRRIFLRFNPVHHKHWIKTEIIDSGKFDVLEHHSTYRDNRFLSDIDKERYENYKNQSDYMYQVYALGEWGVLGDLILQWEVVKSNPIRGGSIYYGLDFGYVNPTAAVRVYGSEKEIYVDEEIYETKLSNEELAALLKPFLGDAYICCDNEDPRSIAALRNAGISALATKKGKGSVIGGIRYLQGKKLYINERCVN